MANLDKLSQADVFLAEGKKHQKVGSTASAIENYRQAIKLNPDLLQAHYELGKLSEKDLEISILHYLETIRINPNFQQVYYRFFWLELDDKHIEKIIESCKQAISLAKNEESVSLISQTIAELLSRQQKILEATKFYRQAMNCQLVNTYPQLVIDNDSDNVRRQYKKPDFMIIGGMKCGTTSLYSYLSKHPQVVPALKKEIHFFTKELDRGLDWYLSHFPSISLKSKLITGEATPCMTVEKVPELVYQHFSKIKIIVILRDPVSRAYSHYNHVAKFFGVNKKFADIIKYNLEDLKTRKLMLKDENAYLSVKCSYLSKGLYYFWLKNWLDLFPREQFLILKTDDLYLDTNKAMQKVFSFLELPNFAFNDYKRELVGSYQPIDRALNAALTQYYAPFNQKLADLLKIEI